MPQSPRDEEFSAFVAERRIELLGSACLLTAGDTHLAEDLVQTALARLYVAWPRVRRSGTEAAYAWRIVVNAHVDQMENPGDPVTISGSPRAGTWDNGWTVRFLSWKKLVRGSALGMAVQTGPDGGTFISPSAVPPSTASFPLQTAKPGSAAAA